MPSVVTHSQRFPQISGGNRVPVAQLVKHWLTDLAVSGSSPARGEIFSTVNGVPLHTVFYCHPPTVLT